MKTHTTLKAIDPRTQYGVSRDARTKHYLEAFDLTDDERARQEWLSKYTFYYATPSFLDSFKAPDVEVEQVESEYTAYTTEQLYSAIEQLNPHQQDIVLGYLCGYTQKQIATSLNITQGAVNLALHGSKSNNGKLYGGALKKLRKILETK